MNEKLPDDLNLKPPAQPKQRPRGADFVVGDIVGNSYQIVDYIGRGAMGYVYRAHHIRLPKEYALKTLSADQVTEVAWVRFQIEAQAIAKMFHPNIVGLHNFGLHKTADGSERPFYVMDLLHGCNLMERLRDYDPPPVNTVLYIFLQAASGFGYAHSKGIIHRDVKPANIVLLNEPDATGSTIKIVDFGIVKLTADADIETQRLTSDEEVFGSPYYMSPEQSLGRSVDARSDIYSLGVTFYETLTGEPPFTAKSAVDIMLMHQTRPTPILNDVVEGGNFPDTVQAVLEMMMAKDPNQRYQTMEHVCSDLIAILQGDEPYYCYNPPGIDGSGNIFLPNTRSTVVASALPAPQFGSSLTNSTDAAAAQTTAGVSNATAGGGITHARDSALDDSQQMEGRALVRDVLNRTGVPLSERAQDERATPKPVKVKREPLDKNALRKATGLFIALAAAAAIVSGASFGVVAWQNYQASLIKPKPAPRGQFKGPRPKIEKTNLDPEEDKEPTTTANEIAPYCEVSVVDGHKVRTFHFPQDCLIGSIYSYDWKASKERTVKAKGTIKFVDSEWLMYLPSRMIAKYPQYCKRFTSGDVAAVRIVDGSDTDAIMEACTAIPGIEQLKFYNTHHLTAKCISAINKFKKITLIDASNSTIDGIMLAKADCYSNLKDFFFSDGVNCAAILAKLKASKHLENIDLHSAHLSYQDFKALSEIGSVRTLNLSYSKVTVNELKQLSKLNQLNTLIMLDCGLDRRAIPILKQFKGLKLFQVMPNNRATYIREMFAAGLPKVSVK